MVFVTLFTQVVGGERFDRVVIATEAPAVPRVLPGDPTGAAAPPTAVFERFPYHPSSIVIHTDPALMPAARTAWRTFNVCQATHCPAPPPPPPARGPRPGTVAATRAPPGPRAAS
jgi:predicted NAD/FAD-binding protein